MSSSGLQSLTPEQMLEEEEAAKRKSGNDGESEKQDKIASEDEISVFLGNVTACGPQMLAVIEENKRSVHAWCICETHLAGEAAAETAHNINGMGLDSFMTRAKPSRQGGFRGGTAILAECKARTCWKVSKSWAETTATRKEARQTSPMKTSRR